MVIRLFRWGVVVGLGAVAVAHHAAADWREPQPFRRDVVDGRQFDYNTESFLHRFTFEPAPGLNEGARPPRDGVFGTAGSARSDELYTRQEIQLTGEFDGPAYFRYRYRRFEDFDGRYDSNLIGIGSGLGQGSGVTATLYGDVEGAKENVDLHGELAWDGGDGNHLRATVVAPDFIFNDKQGDAEYGRYPFTYYLAGGHRLGEALVYGFANYNDNTRLHNHVENFTYRYQQGRAGLGVEVPFADAWEAGLEVEGLYTTRALEDRGDSDLPEQRLRRRHTQVTAELRHAYSPDTAVWGGVRYFRLVARERRPDDPGRVDRQDRLERMAYLGITRRLSERLQLAPGVFVNHADVREREDGDRDDERGFYAKLTLPLQVTVNQSTGGYVALNPTARLHRAAFGGGNVQVYLPF
ncbi:hypothetical protein [Aquisalimonas sp.]|uniref:hypothetical protein n=1 Tax=unclassified Aquisalimonas TaxID=2644645 RepID=UPI0025C05EBC|nr:hypothetical protein [Aquisalimonas sp.]